MMAASSGRKLRGRLAALVDERERGSESWRQVCCLCGTVVWWVGERSAGGWCPSCREGSGVVSMVPEALVENGRDVCPRCDVRCVERLYVDGRPRGFGSWC